MSVCESIAISLGILVAVIAMISIFQICTKEEALPEKKPFIDRFQFKVGDEILAPSGETAVVTRVFKTSHGNEVVGMTLSVKGSSDLA